MKRLFYHFIVSCFHQNKFAHWFRASSINQSLSLFSGAAGQNNSQDGAGNPNRNYLEAEEWRLRMMESEVRELQIQEQQQQQVPMQQFPDQPDPEVWNEQLQHQLQWQEQLLSSEKSVPEPYPGAYQLPYVQPYQGSSASVSSHYQQPQFPFVTQQWPGVLGAQQNQGAAGFGYNQPLPHGFNQPPPQSFPMPYIWVPQAAAPQSSFLFTSPTSSDVYQKCGTEADQTKHQKGMCKSADYCPSGNHKRHRHKHKGPSDRHPIPSSDEEEEYGSTFDMLKAKMDKHRKSKR